MTTSASFANQLLIAMPSMADPNFAHAVVYVCENQPQGSVGLIINKPSTFPMSFIFRQLNIEPMQIKLNERPILLGGPIQPERGFVIHKQAGGWSSSLVLRENVIITTSNDIIRAMAVDAGPQDSLVTLGYTGWSEHQLETEIMNDSWLVCPFSSELLYEIPFEKRWHYAGGLLGVDMNKLSSHSGHA